MADLKRRLTQGNVFRKHSTSSNVASMRRDDSFISSPQPLTAPQQPTVLESFAELPHSDPLPPSGGQGDTQECSGSAPPPQHPPLTPQVSVTSLGSVTMDGTTMGTPGARATGLKPVAMSQGAENVRKIGVEYEGEGIPKRKLMQLDQGMSLTALVKALCEEWNIANPSDYAIAHDKSQYPLFYASEENRSRIHNGHFLQLIRSPQYVAAESLRRVLSPSEQEKTEGLQSVFKYAGDPEFASRLEKLGGMNALVEIVENGECDGDQLGLVLSSFLRLMEHSETLRWNSLNNKFVRQVAAYVANTDEVDVSKCLEPALQILDSVVTESEPSILNSIEHDITPSILIRHVDSRDENIPTCAIALINALFSKVDEARREEYADVLLSKASRNLLLGNVLSGTVGEAMAYQLYVLQHHILNTLSSRLRRCPPDSVITREILELRKLAFDGEGGGMGASGGVASTPPKRLKDPQRDYQKLGFSNPVSPEEELRAVPPGALALDNISYFAKNHYDSYIKVVLENSSRADEHDCPFIRASVELTKLLVELLQVGEPPLEEGSSGAGMYYPMLFTTDKPFEELYCICILLLSKTWKEMKASHQDFNKVLLVLRDQVTMALKAQPTSFDIFKTKLVSYQNIILLRRQQVETKEEERTQARPIKELREMVKPEIVDLIKKHRLNRMIEGSTFSNPNKKARATDRDKFLYCRLSPNGKVLHYGNCTDGAKPPIEALASTINISEIKDFETGTDKKKKEGMTFSMVTETGDTKSFTARTYHDFCVWLDGLHSLRGRQMSSDVYNADLEILLGMEIRLRLLDTEGMDIPDTPPPIPPLPTTMPNGWKADMAARKGGAQTAGSS